MKIRADKVMNTEYNKRFEKEIENYKDVVNIADLPPIFSYHANKYLMPKIQSFGLKNIPDFYITHMCKVHNKIKSNIEIVSVGAGNCDTEIGWAIT
jgi:hypothetical protein